MEHTIEKLKNPLEYVDEHKKVISMNGYAFIDKCGLCIIIVYGEGRRDSMLKYLSEDGDVLNIKYHYIDLPT